MNYKRPVQHVKLDVNYIIQKKENILNKKLVWNSKTLIKALQKNIMEHEVMKYPLMPPKKNILRIISLSSF